VTTSPFTVPANTHHKFPQPGRHPRRAHSKNSVYGIYLPCIAKVAHLPQTKKLSKQAFTSIEEISTAVFHSPYDSYCRFFSSKTPQRFAQRPIRPFLKIRTEYGWWKMFSQAFGFRAPVQRSMGWKSAFSRPDGLGVKISTSSCLCENGLVVKTLKNWTMGTGEFNETLIQSSSAQSHWEKGRTRDWNAGLNSPSMLINTMRYARGMPLLASRAPTYIRHQHQPPIPPALALTHKSPPQPQPSNPPPPASPLPPSSPPASHAASTPRSTS